MVRLRLRGKAFGEAVAAHHVALDVGHDEEGRPQDGGVVADGQDRRHGYLRAGQRFDDPGFADHLMCGVRHCRYRCAAHHPRLSEPVDTEHLAAAAPAHRCHRHLGALAGHLPQPVGEARDVERRRGAVHALASSRWANRARAAASRVGTCSLGHPSTASYRDSSLLATLTLCTSLAPSTRLAIRAIRYIDSSGMSPLYPRDPCTCNARSTTLCTTWALYTLHIAMSLRAARLPSRLNFHAARRVRSFAVSNSIRESAMYSCTIWWRV